MGFMSGKLTTTLIYVVIFGVGWGFMQMRVRILGRTPAARQRTQRNAVLVGGLFALLVAQAWSPERVRWWMGLAAVLVVVTYFVLLIQHIRTLR
jgi:hypothetical protein